MNNAGISKYAMYFQEEYKICNWPISSVTYPTKENDVWNNITITISDLIENKETTGDGVINLIQDVENNKEVRFFIDGLDNVETTILRWEIVIDKIISFHCKNVNNTKNIELTIKPKKCTLLF